MKIRYACTHVIKEVVEDSYEEGEVSGTGHYTMDEGANISSDTLAGLVKAIGDYYCLDMENVRMHERCHEGEDGVRWLYYERAEKDDCEEPTAVETLLWKAGKLKLWTCQFSFKIEKRIVSGLTVEECVAAGIADE